MGCKMVDLIEKEYMPITKPYKDKPLDLSGLACEFESVVDSPEMREIINKISGGTELTFGDIAFLLSIQFDNDINVLFRISDYIRRAAVGDVVQIRAIIEFSNHCRKSCKYCGINSTVKDLYRYRMTESEIVSLAREISETGIHTLVLQSGEDMYWTKKKIESLIKRIKNELGMTITLSIGERTEEEYAAFKISGANNYLLKIETTNPELFKSLHPDDDLEHRMKCSQWLDRLEYINGSGIIIGLPGQTVEDIANDILYFKRTSMSMIGIGPFLPAKETKLEDHEPGNIELTLKTIAATRIVCKRVFMPVTTALTTLSPDAQVKALRCGANVIMIGCTPAKYRENYNIYDNKARIGLQDAIDTIDKAGRLLPEYIKRG